MREILGYFVSFFNEYILDILKSIRIVDILDIIILALVYYYLYTFVRDKRAVKLAIGVVVILALFFISSAFNMYALKSIFENFYQLGFIAIIIVFQPEMRAALEKVGGTSFSGIKNIATESGKLASLNTEIEAICQSASDLARDKVGALIVIERSTKLGEYINSGVTVDAAISPHMLRNIFFNKAPLHDGAVIVRDGRIHAAGCFLPLSTNNDIDKDLGTRHRAALGVTEISDAVVIVVSEETGMISLAVGGNLQRSFNYATLKQELNTLLVSQYQMELPKRHHRKEHK